MSEKCIVCGESADPRWYVARPACDGHGVAFPEAPPASSQQSCPQCGPGAKGDEDGCCLACGSTLCGAWVAELAARAEAAEAEWDEARLEVGRCSNLCTRELEKMRATLSEAEAERDEAKKLLITQTVDDIANIIDADSAQKARSESLAAERDAALARAEKAEADSKRRHELLVDVARAINALGEELVAIPGLAAKVRAERDRYLAAIVEAERLAMKGVRDINDGTWISDIALLLRPIVEEARRG